MILNAETKQKTPQHCSLCRNHGIPQLKRGHKKECPFDNPEHMKTCDKNCPATVERREKVAAEKKEFDHLARDKTAPPVTKTGQRSPNRCRNCQFHGELGLRKDRHGKICPFKDCRCEFCCKTQQRRNAFSKDLKLQRRKRIAMKHKPESPAPTHNVSSDFNSPDSGIHSLDEELDWVTDLDEMTAAAMQMFFNEYPEMAFTVGKAIEQVKIFENKNSFSYFLITCSEGSMTTTI